MSPHLILLIVYSVFLIALGLWLGRRVTRASDFFVARRGLGAGLIFSTMLAANIGTGSTVGATGLAYRDGLSAWWWNGSAGLGSLLLALWVGPRIWREARAHGFFTAGDFLEHHFGAGIRALVTSVLWVATLFILAGQLIGVATILNVVTGLPMAAGSAIGGALITTYFAAGGLWGSAWVNLVQLVILLVGFIIAVPIAIEGVGGWSGLVSSPALPAHYPSFWHGSASMAFLLLVVPPFISSPGLLQKAYGAADERAVRLGTGFNAAALMVFAFVPAVLGMAARVHHPDLPLNQDQLALPTLLAHDLPIGIGSLLLVAIFSAEVSTADAVLFMLATSLSQDLYRRFINRAAPDRTVLRVARTAAVAGGLFGILLAIVLPTIIGALSIFYALIGAGLFVPIIVGLHVRRPSPRAVGVSIVAGMLTVIVAQVMTGGQGFGLVTPAACGLLAAGAGYAIPILASRLKSSGQ